MPWIVYYYTPLRLKDGPVNIRLYLSLPRAGPTPNIDRKCAARFGSREEAESAALLVTAHEPHLIGRFMVEEEGPDGAP